MVSVLDVLAFVAVAISLATGSALALWLAQKGGHAIGKLTGRETIVVRAAEFGAWFAVLLMIFQSFFNPWVETMFSTLGVPLAAFWAAIALFLGGLASSIACVLVVLPVVFLLPRKQDEASRRVTPR